MAINTVSNHVKSYDLPSAAHVAREAEIDIRTLHRWYHVRYRVVDLIAKGLLYERQENE